MSESDEKSFYLFQNKLEIPIGVIPIWPISEVNDKNIVVNTEIFLPYWGISNSNFVDGVTIITNIGELVTLENTSNNNKIIKTNYKLLDSFWKEKDFFVKYYNNQDSFFTFDNISPWKLVDVFQPNPIQIMLRKL